MLTEILARLPLRSIARFKSVCRRWKSVLKSLDFRRLFASVHRNSSSCWSLVRGRKEVMSFHGCETWGLPKSLVSYFGDMVGPGGHLCLYASCYSGLVLVHGNEDVSYVVKIPALPYRYSCIKFGLVTRTDKDGVVLGFKVAFGLASDFTALVTSPTPLVVQ
ncbi:unnamed protein product [Thlaspi arvense]|uniref:F-box domain-containing protein n=1 Tax=Thlaspi arvense TaxID=13288 RepID=A0AAU9T7C6_THLAR|nr:unnamed protein product [Thlaspi arvense]